MTLFEPESTSGLPTPADARRLRLVVAYDGSRYRGFAAQPGVSTVGGALIDAIGRFTRHDVQLTCAGRTDAGVHARGQVVHVDVDPSVEPAALQRAVNRMLGPSIVVRSAEVAPAGFDARRSARWRAYRYLVLVAQTPDPLLAPVAWHVEEELDRRAMRAAADVLLGEHDFRAFCRKAPGTTRQDPIPRLVHDASWSEEPVRAGELGAGPGGDGAALPGALPAGALAAAALLRFDIRAQSFCHQMVRSIVGTLVDVGRGKLRASDVTWLLRTGDRQGAKTIAPPHGLCLTSVAYADLVT